MYIAYTRVSQLAVGAPKGALETIVVGASTPQKMKKCIKIKGVLGALQYILSPDCDTPIKNNVENP